MSIVPATRAPAPAAAEIQLESRHRWIVVLAEAAELAHAIANTNFVPAAMRGDEAAITAAILYGDEVGLTPMQSLSKISVIDGRPSLAAEAQRALILAAGHSIWFEEMTTTKATVAGIRRDGEQIQRVTWTLDDARRAGLVGKRNWRTYPRAMLIARSSAELARAMFADAIGGLAATEELEESDPEQIAEPEPAPAKQTTRRRRARTTRPVVAAAPPPAPEPDEPPLPDEDLEPVPGVTPEQMRHLFALFGERGITDRAERLAWVNEQLDRPIESSNDLTLDEASILISALKDDDAAPPVVEAPPANPAAPAAPDAQTTLEDAGAQILDVTEATVEMIQWQRREAGMPDSWIREKLIAIGLEDAPARPTKATIGRLSQAQARELQAELNSIIDARQV